MRDCGCDLVHVTVQVWLQEVAWTETDKPVKLAARSDMIPNNPNMNQQPLFCYETMLNLLYWSCLVYDHDRVRPGAVAPLATNKHDVLTAHYL